MKKTIGILVVLALVVVGVVLLTSDSAEAPQAGPDNEGTETSELSGTDTYVVESADSEIVWIGTRSLIADYEDSGTVEVASGTVAVADGEVTEAEIVIDMTTINAQETSNTEAGVDRLTGHLRSDDFFGVEEFPTATLTVTSVDDSGSDGVLAPRYQKQVTADLTIRDQTHEVTFPAKIYETADGQLAVEAELELDRTQWNVRYGSDQFFDNLGDSVIDDEFQLDVYIVATPQDQVADDAGDDIETTTTTEATNTPAAN